MRTPTSIGGGGTLCGCPDHLTSEQHTPGCRRRAPMNDLPLSMTSRAVISWLSETFLIFPRLVTVSYSYSAVYTSICAEYLPNELHSIGGRRVEWLNPGGSEPDHLGSITILLHHTGCDLRQVNYGLQASVSLSALPSDNNYFRCIWNNAYKTFNRAPST